MPNGKLWLLLAVGIMLILLSVHVTFASNLAKMQTQMLGVSAQINANCSGTLIHSERAQKDGEVTTYVLTAKHCINGKGKLQIVDLPVYQKMRVVKTERYWADVKAQDHRADLALLVLKDRQTWFEATATLAAEDTLMVMGERVWTVGYPLGGTLAISEGLFGLMQTVDWPKDGVEYFRATPDATFGNSGGSLYRATDAGDFELIGVVTARMRDNTFMTLYTPITDIAAFLKRVDAKAFGGERKPGGPNSR